MANGEAAGVRAFVTVGNVIILSCGIALAAVSIFVITDPHRIYPLVEQTMNTDLFASAWISVFTGFAFFLLGMVGIAAAWMLSKRLFLVYIILMIVVFVFEAASCITAFTHKDYLMTNNFLKRQMLLEYGGKNKDQFTESWKYMMAKGQCCGADGPEDWMNYTSTLMPAGDEWPSFCCVRDNNYDFVKKESCKMGVRTAVITQGCSKYFEGAIEVYTWSIGWFGFAILCVTLFVMLAAMYLFNRLDWE
uniref:Tetraspanin n=1 Tax=Eptatretus burgeri TaxID=7764 RepID=A0A8C4QFD8_EPTBU